MKTSLAFFHIRLYVYVYFSAVFCGESRNNFMLCQNLMCEVFFFSVRFLVYSRVGRKNLVLRCNVLKFCSLFVTLRDSSYIYENNAFRLIYMKIMHSSEWKSNLKSSCLSYGDIPLRHIKDHFQTILK